MERDVVLITGCSSGTGKALSIAFHEAGYRVTATARRVESMVDLEAKGLSVDRLDVTRHNDIERVVRSLLDREGRIDVLVNNAGFGLIVPMMDVSDEELQRQFRTNVFGVVHLIQAIAPSMRANNSGTVINIGSISGVATTPFAGSYCASKAAIHALSDAFRMELAPFGIRVICVQPGGIESNFGNASRDMVQGNVGPESWYSSVREYVIARAQESQSDPMPARDLANKIVRLASLKNPPAVVRIGTRSVMLPLLKNVLPTYFLDSLFRKRFGLHKLSTTE